MPKSERTLFFSMSAALMTMTISGELQWHTRKGKPIEYLCPIVETTIRLRMTCLEFTCEGRVVLSDACSDGDSDGDYLFRGSYL